MNLVLSSDFPSTPNPALCARLRTESPKPRIVCIAPFSEGWRQRFPIIRERFAVYGFSGLEYCDIDENPDTSKLSNLDEYHAIYLTGGNPIGFRQNILRTGLDESLQRCAENGRLIIGASGGATQLTKNFSLFRLLSATVADVVADHVDFEGLDLVGYEILPHLNRHDPSFLEIVLRYSERVNNSIIALADGAAIFHTNRDDYQCIGRVEQIHNRKMTPIEPSM